MPIRKSALVATLSAAALLLGGCAVGFDAATTTQGDSGDGRSADLGALQIRNATVVVDPADTTRGTVLMTIINTDDVLDDVLTGVTVTKSVGVEGEVNVPLPHKDVVNVGFDSEYRIVLTSMAGGIEPGNYVDVSFIFKSGQSVPLSLLVNAKANIYADTEIPALALPIQPAPAQPSPAPTAS